MDRAYWEPLRCELEAMRLDEAPQRFLVLFCGLFGGAALLLGAVGREKGAGTVVGMMFLGLLIDIGIVAARRAMMKGDEASLDARQREKSDRSGKLSEACSALSAIERSIREKDRKMKEIFESLSVKESMGSSRAGSSGEE